MFLNDSANATITPMTFDPTDPRWTAEGIRLVPHDPSWTATFLDQATQLRSLIGDWLTGGLHHVGSTAIPGIHAKPVIDILGGVESLERSRPCIDLLAGEGWCYAPYRCEEMHWFCYPAPDHREYHLHLAPTDGRWFTDELAFRDYLRTNPDSARAYEDLKLQLATRFPDDREAYTDAKSDFIQQVLRRAKQPGTPTSRP